MGTGLPYWSSTVTVKVVVLAPSAVTDRGLATNVVVVLFGEPAVKVTAAVSVTPPMVAVTSFTCAVVDAKVAVNTPATLVLPANGVIVLPVPLLFKETAWEGTGLPWASFTVTVRVVVVTPLATSVVGLATKEDWTLLGEPAVKVMDAVSVADPTVAVRVSTCATVDESVAVKMPLPLVGPEAGAKVLAVPLPDNATF